MLVFDTICASATGTQRAALNIVRLSGPDCFAVISKMIRKDICSLEIRKAYLLKLYSDKENQETFLDEAVVVLYKGPNSYTGFDSADISVHGSPLIVENIIKAMIENGARRAEKGEFTAQAFFNKKMDLLRAEGINDVIMARNERALQIAQRTMSGKNKEEVERFKNELLDLIAGIEYHIEDQYTEEEDYSSDAEKVLLILKEEEKKWKDVLRRTRKNNISYRGIKVAIVGEPNVGKSTLLNSILGKDKAIVSSIPGTTRDVVEGEIEVEGLSILFQDTAGVREGKDEIESIGIRKTFETIKEADVILWVDDISFSKKNIKELEDVFKGKKIIKIGTKKDLGIEVEGADISLCSFKDDLNVLYSKIIEVLDLQTIEESAFLGKREEDCILNVVSLIQESVSLLENSKEIDIASDCMRRIVEVLNELLGEGLGNTAEDIYDTLFSKFCLGK